MRADIITLRRARERHRLHSGGQNLWLSFYPALRTAPLADGFGALAALNEGVLPPEGSMLTYCRKGSEIVTYVIDGSLSHKDGSGRRCEVLRSGDFQRSSVSDSDHVSFSNASGRDALHVVQLSLHAMGPRPPQRPAERKSFPVAERVGSLRLVASGDGRLGSLSLDQDVRLYSGVLGAGQEIEYRLGEGRSAWLQLVSGELFLDDVALVAGDGVGVRLAGTLPLRASSAAEFVLLDLAGAAPCCSTRADGHVSSTPAKFAAGTVAHG